MKRHRKIVRTTRIHVLCYATAIVLMSNAAAVVAATSPPAIRINNASDKFDGTTQLAAAFEIPSSSLFRTHHIEFSIGSISTPNGNEAFASIGPVWRIPLSRNYFFADIGISPTLISGSNLGGRDLGGPFHFTSSISIGTKLGQTNSVALRIQHMSNAGLSETNPGMDAVGIQFSLGFSR